MNYGKWIPKLQVAIGNYIVTDSFYVVNLVDKKLFLGVQWLYSIGEHTMNYKFLEMRFKYSEGKPILLRGIHTYPNQVVSSHSMRSTLRNGDIEWTTECLITSSKPHLKVSKHLKELKHFLGKYEKAFGDLPPGRPPNRGVE